MGKASTKENKTPYQTVREELGYTTRTQASSHLMTISPERLEKIENERSVPSPEEVLEMADCYHAPHLCNHYCAKQCPIGEQYVPEIKTNSLAGIVIEMVAALNEMHHKQEKLISIAADGKIAHDEVEDFVRIQKELEKISQAVESLQLWSEQMVASGAIDMESYNYYKNR